MKCLLVYRLTARRDLSNDEIGAVKYCAIVHFLEHTSIHIDPFLVNSETSSSLLHSF